MKLCKASCIAGRLLIGFWAFNAPFSDYVVVHGKIVDSIVKLASLALKFCVV